MDEQKIRSIVQQEIGANDSRSRFSLNSIPRHTHDNINSPFVFQPTLTYTGFINYDGSIALLPIGWSVTYDGTGGYNILHNLGTSTYVTVASAQQSTNAVVATVMEQFPNEVDFEWFKLTLAGPSAQATSFTFTITVINNKYTQPVKYGGTLTG